jgi:hypothetical protein
MEFMTVEFMTVEFMTVMGPQYFWWRGCCFAALNVHPNAARGQACILPMVTHRMRPGCGPDASICGM